MYSGIYQSVLEWVPEGARVLDLGTGDGEFLERLVRTKHVVAEGVERNPDWVARCIRRGLVVHQGDIADGLDQYAQQTFDYVLLLGTFQELIAPGDIVREAFRVGHRVVIAYSNFAYYRVRLQSLFRGRTPVTKSLPQAWFRTTNSHFLSILDFREFCSGVGMTATRQAYFSAKKKVTVLPNFFAEEGVELLEASAPIDRSPSLQLAK